MDRADISAIGLMNNICDSLEAEQKYAGVVLLAHAIGHLARPDRIFYPKSRKGTKGRPVLGKGFLRNTH